MENQIHIFDCKSQLALESGQYLPRFSLAYQTFGKLNHSKSNVIWIIHALTANSDPTEWWSEIVGPGLAIDTERYFVVCANTLGSHYGSTNPLSINPETGVKYFHQFPLITNRDIVKAFMLLAQYLNIPKINTLIGPSIGGQQAIEWSITQPDFIEKLILIATNAVHSPFGIAFNESQRMAIELDSTWLNDNEEAGIKGMEVARSIALISYRTIQGYNQTQRRGPEDKLEGYKASSYQRYQGQKLSSRFNAFSYYLLSKAMDSHDIGRGRGDIQVVLNSIKSRTLVIGIKSDILFPPDEQKLISDHIKDSELIIINSRLGHDGFLTETRKISQCLKHFINESAIYNV